MFNQFIRLPLILAIGFSIIFYQHVSAFAPLNNQETTPVSAGGRLERFFPKVPLVTHEGEKVWFYQDLIRGKVVLINLMFTSCTDICPLTSLNLARVQKAFGDQVGREVFLYSITLDADYDSPDVLKKYAHSMGAKEGWSFLTGKYEDIEDLRYSLGMYDPDPIIDADKTQHGGLILYGNDVTGRWAATPVFTEPESIVKAVRKIMRKKNTSH